MNGAHKELTPNENDWKLNPSENYVTEIVT